MLRSQVQTEVVYLTGENQFKKLYTVALLATLN